MMLLLGDNLFFTSIPQRHMMWPINWLKREIVPQVGTHLWHQFVANPFDLAKEGNDTMDSFFAVQE